MKVRIIEEQHHAHSQTHLELTVHRTTKRNETQERSPKRQKYAYAGLPVTGNWYTPTDDILHWHEVNIRKE